MPTSFSRHNFKAWLILAGALTVCWAAYAPGLHGGFLFDDFANLPALGAYGTVDSWPTLWRYLTSGTADPTGRPLSLASFLIDARDWPADPYAFKRTNVLLHMGNGVLLYILLHKLGTVLDHGRKAAMAAALASAVWLLHPFLVSTTLYIVQREAMLPASFILLGLIGYVGGRELAARGHMTGVVLAAISIALGTTLATLSKANGALLPLLAWLIDAIILRPKRPLPEGNVGRAFRMAFGVVIAFPSLLLVMYLVKIGTDGFRFGTPPHRPWTLGERLLTESRILVDYLWHYCFPKPYTKGLFNDAIQVSTSLLQPWTTLISIILISSLLFFAYTVRRQWPALAAAIAFFFTAHLMESSVVLLELYYEHRNYVPALLLAWPLALWLFEPPAQRKQNQPSVLIRVKPILALAIPFGLALLTWMRADLWGNLHEQASLWAVRNPESPRAQAYAAQMDVIRGDHTIAITRLEPVTEQRTDEIQVALNLVGIKCSTGALTTNDLERAAVALRSTRNFERMGYSWFERSIEAAARPPCPLLNIHNVAALLEAAKDNPHAGQVAGRRQDIKSLEARLALVDGNGERALDLFNAALDENLRPGAALAQAALLGNKGRPDLAVRHLDYFERSDWRPPTSPIGTMPTIHQWILGRQGYWEREFAGLRSALENEG